MKITEKQLVKVKEVLQSLIKVVDAVAPIFGVKLKENSSEKKY